MTATTLTDSTVHTGTALIGRPRTQRVCLICGEPSGEHLECVRCFGQDDDRFKRSQDF